MLALIQSFRHQDNSSIEALNRYLASSGLKPLEAIVTHQNGSCDAMIVAASHQVAFSIAVNGDIAARINDGVSEEFPIQIGDQGLSLPEPLSSFLQENFKSEHGRIEYAYGEDRWNNLISKIVLPNGKDFRLIHTPFTPKEDTQDVEITRFRVRSQTHFIDAVYIQGNDPTPHGILKFGPITVTWINKKLRDVESRTGENPGLFKQIYSALNLTDLNDENIELAILSLTQSLSTIKNGWRSKRAFMARHSNKKMQNAA